MAGRAGMLMPPKLMTAIASSFSTNSLLFDTSRAGSYASSSTSKSISPPSMPPSALTASKYAFAPPAAAPIAASGPESGQLPRITMGLSSATSAWLSLPRGEQPARARAVTDARATTARSGRRCLLNMNCLSLVILGWGGGGVDAWSPNADPLVGGAEAFRNRRLIAVIAPARPFGANIRHSASPRA